MFPEIWHGVRFRCSGHERWQILRLRCKSREPITGIQTTAFPYDRDHAENLVNVSLTTLSSTNELLPESSASLAAESEAHSCTKHRHGTSPARSDHTTKRRIHRTNASSATAAL